MRGRNERENKELRWSFQHWRRLSWSILWDGLLPRCYLWYVFLTLHSDKVYMRLLQNGPFWKINALCEFDADSSSPILAPHNCARATTQNTSDKMAASSSCVSTTMRGRTNIYTHKQTYFITTKAHLITHIVRCKMQWICQNLSWKISYHSHQLQAVYFNCKHRACSNAILHACSSMCSIAKNTLQFHRPKLRIIDRLFKSVCSETKIHK